MLRSTPLLPESRLPVHRFLLRPSSATPVLLPRVGCPAVVLLSMLPRVEQSRVGRQPLVLPWMLPRAWAVPLVRSLPDIPRSRASPLARHRHRRSRAHRSSVRLEWLRRPLHRSSVAAERHQLPM
ncbi:MAG: hypothetical protein WBB00_28505 [Mycobacterium sp.]